MCEEREGSDDKNLPHDFCPASPDSQAHLESKGKLNQEPDEGREALIKADTEMETEVEMEAGSGEEPKDESLFWLDFKIRDAVTKAVESDPSDSSVVSLENDTLNDNFRFNPEELISSKHTPCTSSDCIMLDTSSTDDRIGDGPIETCMQHPCRGKFRQRNPYTLTMRDF